MQKILIIGVNGFLGSNLAKFGIENRDMRNSFSIIGSDIKDSNISNEIAFHYLDITDQKQVLKKVKELLPDIIILTAAMTNVDDCERNKKQAIRINLSGPQNVIKVCKELNLSLVFLSTDFIFGGKKNEGYSETDIPKPINYYGETKYMAELSIFSSGINYIICRTAVLYGWNKTKLNFITWILKNLKEGKEIQITKNQFNSPTYINNLVEIIFQLIRNEARGIFHTAGNCILSRYEIAKKCAKIFGYNPKLIKPIEEIHQLASRPKKAGLKVSKLKRFLYSEVNVMNLEEGLKHMKKNESLYQ